MRVRDGVYWLRERGMFDANTYVLQDELTVLIDPGLESYLEPRLNALLDDGIAPGDIDVIAITHLHPDHCSAVAALQEVSGAKVALHPLQEEYREIMDEGLRDTLGVGITKKFRADIVLADRLSLGSTDLKILHTPGHSPASICFYSEALKLLICGDLVFEQGVGRADLPFGNFEELKTSIETVSALDTEVLLPGHGGILEGQNYIKRNYEFVKMLFTSDFSE
jgi:glyoxylase-like metal-dependent hydrolase (beta-lactamase superfamily II)